MISPARSFPKRETAVKSATFWSGTEAAKNSLNFSLKSSAAITRGVSLDVTAGVSVVASVVLSCESPELAVVVVS